MTDFETLTGLAIFFACVGVILLAAHVGGSIQDDEDPDGGPF